MHRVFEMSKIGQYIFEMMEKSGEFEYDNFYSPIDLNKPNGEKNEHLQKITTGASKTSICGNEEVGTQ